MSTKQEAEILALKKELRTSKKQIKELQTHNKFLIERLDNWAERNFDLRQRLESITVDEVVANRAAKSEYIKEKELAHTLEVQQEQAQKIQSG